jgi:hypothetical protein
MLTAYLLAYITYCMNNDLQKFWDNIPHETNRYKGDEAHEAHDPVELVQEARSEDIKLAREFSD